MIAGCIDKFRQETCGDCDRRDACASLFKAFGLQMRPKPAGAPQARAAPLKSPFLSFLGEVAKIVEAGVKPRETPLRREVERRLEPMLEAGAVRIDEVARELGLSRQTLYRRLKAEGFTFEEILDALRRRLAIRLMRQGHPVKEVAYRLGFSDPAAFSRAFKRWTGKSPTGMRGPKA